MKVLLGIGGSDDSLEALDRTVERAVEAGDELTVAVLDNPESERSAEAVIEHATETVEDAGLDADVRHITGDPGSELVQLAEREAFDQVVLGGGERSPMGKIRLGHIAEFVLLNAPVTVTLVR
ncbi:universal stress protein [Halarchaeum sp. CBA1220]|uniref:Universal stress protein UspA n=1 Tax=Halarchaeum grantii TaxID=1193105 RepID=A0A830F8B9_9EURY|nr:MULTISPECIES: universal stress protein [Halarchaeum]QLC33263.1 universal stress protein [Halarchaeum sp. CBA1220]GGL29091.1 universal stress protein UspA [Halarchaeum grantii]